MDLNGKYLFERNGERLTARQIAYVLEKYSKQQGIQTKSTHKIRKSMLPCLVPMVYLSMQSESSQVIPNCLPLCHTFITR